MNSFKICKYLHVFRYQIYSLKLGRMEIIKMNPKELELTDVETLRCKWKRVTTKQTICAFYMARDEKLGLLSNFAIHEPFQYCVPFGSFAGEIMTITFSEKAIMLNKVSRYLNTKHSWVVKFSTK